MRPALSGSVSQRSHSPEGWRARRFDLNLPVWYRLASEHEWHKGSTQSISASGAIIRADEPSVPVDPIVIAISLPAVPGCLVGRGHIVRTLSSDPAAGETTFAVAVDHYRIGRRNEVLSSGS
jgi:hypothetical protein